MAERVTPLCTITDHPFEPRRYYDESGQPKEDRSRCGFIVYDEWNCTAMDATQHCDRPAYEHARMAGNS